MLRLTTLILKIDVISLYFCKFTQEFNLTVKDKPNAFVYRITIYSQRCLGYDLSTNHFHCINYNINCT